VDRKFIWLIPSYQGEVETGLAHLKRVEISRIFSPRFLTSITPRTLQPQDYPTDTPFKKLHCTRCKVSQETWESSEKIPASRRWFIRNLNVSDTLLNKQTDVTGLATLTPCNYLYFDLQRVKQFVLRNSYYVLHKRFFKSNNDNVSINNCNVKWCVV